MHNLRTTAVDTTLLQIFLETNCAVFLDNLYETLYLNKKEQDHKLALLYFIYTNLGNYLA